MLLRAHLCRINHLSLLDDNATLITLGGCPQALRFWDVRSLRPLGEPLTAEVGLFAALSPDGKRLALSSNQEVLLYDLAEASWPRLQRKIASLTNGDPAAELSSPLPR